jgi:hypothetical protein
MGSITSGLRKSLFTFWSRSGWTLYSSAPWLETPYVDPEFIGKNQRKSGFSEKYIRGNGFVVLLGTSLAMCIPV